MTLTREQILEADDLRMEEVMVPEWGGTVWVRGMSGAERSMVEEYTASHPGREALRAIVTATCTRNEAGERLFTLEDVEALNDKNGAALQRVFEAASRLSSMLPAAAEKLRKN